MTLTFDAILRSAGIDPTKAQAIRHAFVREHEDTGLPGIHADSTDEEILAYTSEQSANPRVFPASPPRLWAVFIREGGDRARLWSVLENRGEVSNDGAMRTFDLVETEHLADLRDRLVIGWRSPRTWRLNGPTAAGYPVMEIADAKPIPFPGFDRLVLDRAQLLAVMRERAGRVILNGFPTGVEVGHAMVHGGPFPATSDGQSTSVGTRAIERFSRPFAYQDFPDSALPPELQNANPLGLWRVVGAPPSPSMVTRPRSPLSRTRTTWGSTTRNESTTGAGGGGKRTCSTGPSPK